jgi:hypothetical protein
MYCLIGFGFVGYLILPHTVSQKRAGSYIFQKTLLLRY